MLRILIYLIIAPPTLKCSTSKNWNIEASVMSWTIRNKRVTNIEIAKNRFGFLTQIDYAQGVAHEAEGPTQDKLYRRHTRT